MENTTRWGVAGEGFGTETSFHTNLLWEERFLCGVPEKGNASSSCPAAPEPQPYFRGGTSGYQ